MVLSSGQEADVEAIVASAVKNIVNNESFLNAIADRLAIMVVAKLEERVNSLADKCQHLDDKVKQLTIDKEDLSNQLDALEQHDRRCNLRIFGVRETANEKCDDVAVDVLKAQLGVHLQATDIDRCHRVGVIRKDKDTNGVVKPRALIVKFANTRSREQVLQKRKVLKGSGYVIHEDLTKERIGILNSAIKKFGQKNVWSWQGAIWIYVGNRRHRVTNAADLNKIQHV